jgi:DNA-binding LacI/PurR family transcriptional regulator
LKKYSISEVARLCGTSKASISRVLNHPEIVSEALRNKIYQKMKEIGYTPNPFARRLGAQSTWGVALFVFDIINPFFSSMVKEIGRFTMEHGIPLTVCETENSEEKERTYLDLLLENRIGGIIFTEGVSRSIVDNTKDHVPVVLVDQHYARGNIPEVTSDNFSGAQKATEYLIQLNHEKIGFVAGPLDWPSARERMNGYKSALKKNSLPFDERLIFHGDFQFESGLRAMEYYLSSPEWPTAIFCSNDQMALGVLNKAYTMNISIPDDLSLVGFDDIPLFSFIKPRITTVRQNVPSLCEKAVELIMKQLNGEVVNERIYVPTELVAGESCKKISPRSVIPG